MDADLRSGIRAMGATTSDEFYAGVPVFAAANVVDRNATGRCPTIG